MTDRVRSFTVVLDQDYRTDDLEQIINTVLMIKGVASVTPQVVESSDYITRQTLSIDFRQKLYKCVAGVLDGKDIHIDGKEI